MKVFSILALLLWLSVSTFAQKLSPVDADSKVQFVIKNFGIKVDGQLKDVKGSIIFDPLALNNSVFNITVNANTINTDNTARDKHLKKSDYFDVAQFPLISFKSTKISKTVAGQYKVSGNLTIKGISKLIEFEFAATALNNGYQFKGSFTMNRRDFKVGGNSLPLSDNLTVYLDIKAINI